MPFDLDRFPYLRGIIRETYQNRVTFKASEIGAHDTNWSKEFELFYNKQPNSKPYVERIFLREDKPRGKTIGFVNLRPISDASHVSETYLTPPESLSEENGVYITCMDEFNEYGHEIECVPYVMPDSIFGMCIHASIWICLKILENQQMIENCLSIPEIQTYATGRPYTDKQGLLFVQATRILRMCRTSAFYVNNKVRPYLSDEQMLMELYAYIESGLPVILGVDTGDLPWWLRTRNEFHSIVAIGYTKEGNETTGFVFHDESAYPYKVLTTDQLLSTWHHKNQTAPNRFTRELLVAVPPQVSLQFTEAYQQFEEMLSELRNREIISERTDGFHFRPMLTTSMDVFFETGRNALFFLALREAHFPRHVWVFHLFDVNDDGRDLEQSEGFYVRDASRETEFRFVYIKETRKAIYQIDEEKIYERGFKRGTTTPKKRRQRL